MDSFSAYLKEIGRYPLLTKTQEILLARQIQIWLTTENPTPKQIKSGERAYHKLVNCNLRLVVSVAKRYTNRCRKAEIFDLVQEGNMGLAHGIKKFDPERGYALSTYVYWWIRQSITRFLATYDRTIRLPSHAVELLTKLRAWTPVFENTHYRKPTLEECADFCKISPTRMREYLDRSHDAISLDAPLKGMDDDVMLVDGVSCGTDVFEDVCMGIDVEAIDHLLESLNDLERTIITKAFGFETGEPMTFQAIAKELGMSRERARNIYHRTIRVLRIKKNR
ncbi:sigma-70 family RNA polymerase sigma factor [Limnobacter sp.]|uniref:sigma-70 family RNA polymerase sigma factor n=1 Tax=Limnobacter sp. TaxID=2003368 RepID=UPI0025B92302|nr:sigma-70 family RNA polymerase sigma factor [Limnobacter sp.]